MNRSPAIGKMCHGGMESRFNRSQWNLENIADLFIGELVKIGEQENLPQVIRHAHHSVMYQALELFFLHALAWRLCRGFHQVDELTAFLIAGADGSLERIGRSAGLGSHEIAGFIGRDREQPGPKPPLWIKLCGRLMHLKERFLEDVLCRSAVAQKADEEMKQFTLVSCDELGEGGLVAVAVALQQMLVACRLAGDGCCGGRGLLWPICALCIRGWMHTRLILGHRISRTARIGG
jgi:hypothetical protein